MAERVKCKPPKKEVARAEPVRAAEPQGSTDEESDLEGPDSLVDDALGRARSRSRSPSPVRFRVIRQPPVEEPDVDLDALRDKYRPKSAPKADRDEPKVVVNDTKPLAAKPKPLDDDHDDDDKNNTGTIMLEPIRPPTPPLEEIKVEPIQPTYVEMKKPLKSK